MKKLFSILAAMMILLCINTAVSAKNYVNDYAGILSQAEIAELESLLESVSDKHNIDAVIVTVNDTNGQSIVDFSDDFFDYGGYGRGNAYSGILMTLSIGPDERYISTCGSCIYAFTDKVISYVGKNLAKSADAGDYSETCYKFVGFVDDVMTQYEEKGQYSVPVSLSTSNMIVIMIIALIIALVISGMVKSGMNTAITPVNADIYTKGGSAKITASRDMFLYTHISKSERKTSSGGGSSTHTSSSGRSHGGGSF